MHVDLSLIKEEIDIDDTTIKLEVEENAPDEPMDVSCASEAVKILEEHADMITVPLSEQRSEDERQFIASLGTIDAQQLFEDSLENQNGCAYECHICNMKLPTQMEVKAHLVNHQMNRHFCRHGCGTWSGTLELALEHEYRKHYDGILTLCCRICDLRVDGADHLASHMKSHSYLTRYVCAICRRNFYSQVGLLLHRKNTTYVCGQLEYIPGISATPEQVAANPLTFVQNQHEEFNPLRIVKIKDEPLSVVKVKDEPLSSVKIKDEPLDVDGMDPAALKEAGLDVHIKDEPLDVATETADATDFIPTEEMPDSSKGSIWDSLPVELRGKLRLPALKPKPAMTNTPRPPLKFVKMNVPPPASNAAPVGVQRSIFKVLPNGQKVNITDLLSLKKLANFKTNVHESTKPPISSNILKVLPNNCMVIKLPPNTKIVKLTNQPSALAAEKASEVPSSPFPQNGSPQLPKSLTISKITREETIFPVPTAGAVDYKPINPHRDRGYSLKNRPECQELITEIQNQIRSIEKTLPLPGTVLFSRADLLTNSVPVPVPPLPPTVTLPGEPVEMEVFLNPMAHTVMGELRKKHPDYNFFWTCPICGRTYVQGYSFRAHLIQEHKQTSANLLQLKVKLKPQIKSSWTETVEPSKNKPDSDSSVSEPAPLDDLVLEKPSKPATPKKEITSVTASDPVIEIGSSESEPKESYIFKPSDKLKNAKIDETNLSQYQCPTCLKIFTTQGGMRIHMSIHTGEMPYQCHYCDKRFRTPGQVRVHERRHTGEKPFQCKICCLEFTHRETLISHLSRHIGMKRYKCYGCDKYFVVVSGLRAHRRLRPDTCGKVKFTARAHGPRVRVIKGEVVFEHQPSYNGYLRSEDPLEILKEREKIEGKAKPEGAAAAQAFPLAAPLAAAAPSAAAAPLAAAVPSAVAVSLAAAVV
ncbi:uncharacterized protein LOC117900260 [Drosophila subobscura]|uniref:uncharacterized protein LOC117900260 n=1 Tax=Drosophila subobscura TaxID=7241 RepID=UPI00155A1668|nr:uncharacterized protein LOC117900260 [Drosophila subobscura]